MLKIVSRPPYDDFSIKLFFSLYSKKKMYGLGNALFMYMWTSPISIDTGLYMNKSLIFNAKYRDMDVYFAQSSNALRISGDKQYFNDREELFFEYLNVSGNAERISDSEEMELMREEFYRQLDVYSQHTYNRREMEKLIDDTITNCNMDTIVLFIKDHFRMNMERSWIDPMPELSTYFSDMCDYFSDKKFVIVTSLENLDKEINKPNCTIVNMGGDITNQISLYKEHTPDLYKNTDTSKNFISLNRGPRYHRMYLIASLYARNLDEYGQISFLSIPDNKSLKDLIVYDYENDRNYNKANNGVTKYHSVSHVINDDLYDIYHNKPNDNLTNFKDSLQHKYRNSYIEFISETSYNELSFNITEKTLHFVYGCNYPIMVSSPGTVAFLRKMGLDMFDDFIDHSYDDIIDPAERINEAIDRNLGVLTMDKTQLHKRWESDKYRMEENISFMKNNLATFYQDRFWEQIKGLSL